MNHPMDSATAMASPRVRSSSDTMDPLKMDVVPASGHVLAMDDQESPQNLPLSTKIHVSGAAFALAFVVSVLLFVDSRRYG